jgi:hypothetical protein
MWDHLSSVANRSWATAAGDEATDPLSKAKTATHHGQ